MELSAGKYWCLRRLADADGFFRMVAVDQRPPIINLVAERRGTTASYEDVGAVKALLIQELTATASALLLDPGYAYPYAIQHVDPAKGLLVTLEHWEFEQTPDGGRKTACYPNWSVEKIKRLGADGVKLMLWYRPDAAADVLRHQQALVERVGRDCRAHDIAFLIEPLVYPLGGGAGDYAESPDKRAELVVETVRELANERYGIDIFKLESPLPTDRLPDPAGRGADVAAADRWFAAIDRLLDRPWVMLSAGAGMAPFRRVLGFAFRNGASGYLAGRAIWWQAFQAFPDMDAFRARLRRDGLAYVAEIGRMLQQSGTPWTKRRAFRDGIRLRDAGPDFFARYGS